MHHPTIHSRRRRARGFTLVELMIAILIGVFLAGGLVTLVQAMKRTTASQNGLSQLQDNERMSMSLIANAVQSAGYYPNPLVNSASTFFTAYSVAPVVLAASQSLTGSANATAALGDTITLRYTTAGNDNVLNCAGATSATQKTWTATFSIDANSNLQCYLYDGTAYTTVQLVNGVTKLEVWYGVQTNGSSLYNSADTYLAAASMTAAYWNSVRSVKIRLTFNNPLHGQPGQTTVGPTVQFTRVITVMNSTGVDT